MPTDRPSFSSIEYGPYFFELVFTDFERATIAQWLSLSEQRYPVLRHAPWLRALVDMRDVEAITPHVLAAFERVISREYAASSLRIAFLVRRNLIGARVEYSTGAFYHLYRKARAISRYFRDRERALEWLREGLPLEAALDGGPSELKTEK
ncbi:MAG: hypothetical protein IT323_16770 [Anaerolineae bacterium]|nr:hypothetical protein [Anaerolineae bacterium]